MDLADRFIPVFVYVLECLRSLDVQQPAFDEVQGAVIRLLREGETSLPPECRDDFDLARFAVCAWVDEAMASSSWEHRPLWLKQQLQRVYYRTTAAGAEFFERLDGLTPAQRGVREIFYLCLVLGFTGRFCNPGDQQRLEELKSVNLALVLGNDTVAALERGEYFSGSSTGGEVPGSESPRRSFPVLMALGLAAPPLSFGLLFLVYRFILTGIGEGFLQGVAN